MLPRSWQLSGSGFVATSTQLTEVAAVFISSQEVVCTLDVVGIYNISISNVRSTTTISTAIRHVAFDSSCYTCSSQGCTTNVSAPSAVFCFFHLSVWYMPACVKHISSYSWRSLAFLFVCLFADFSLSHAMKKATDLFFLLSFFRMNNLVWGCHCFSLYCGKIALLSNQISVLLQGK